jgi:hypothetical protein
MLVLNFTHPLTPEQVAQLENLTGEVVDEIRAISTQLGDCHPFFSDQVVTLADVACLSSEEWRTRQLLVVPPALNFAAFALLAELHGRMGCFPTVVRLRPASGTTPRRFEVAEVINLQVIRDSARKRR